MITFRPSILVLVAFFVLGLLQWSPGSTTTTTCSAAEVVSRIERRRIRGEEQRQQVPEQQQTQSATHRRRRVKHKGLLHDDTLSEPPVPYSTKSPSTTLAPTLPPAAKGITPPPGAENTLAPSSWVDSGSSAGEQAPTGDPSGSDQGSGAADTASPVTSPTEMPSTEDANGAIAAPSVAPVSEDWLSPSEVAAEQSRSRSLLPFSLVVEGETISVDNVDQVMETFLFDHLSQPFGTLERILLTVSSANRKRSRLLMEKTFDFIGVAMFLQTDERLPTEQQVQQEQLKALQEFTALDAFVKSQGYDWTINTIILDGMTIDDTGIKIGDKGIGNDGDSLVQNGSESSSSGTNPVALSLSLVGVLLVLCIAGFLLLKRGRRRKGAEEVVGKESLEGLMGTDDKEPESEIQNISFDVTLANTSYDSAHIPSNDFRPELTSGSMDWNRVFALSQTPVEETYGEIFEPKKLAPPKEHKTHEIVTLASVTEVQGGRQVGDTMPGGDEDSYGYNVDDEGMIDESLTMSPIARAEYENANDNDQIIDLAEFDKTDFGK